MISIVIPAFNAENTLADTIESALDSGLSTQQIILVDDGSEDSTWGLISKYSSKYKCIVKHQHSKNRGGGAARNSGVRLSNYEYIFVLDSDDILINGSLSVGLRDLELNKADGVASGKSVFFKETTDEIYKTINYQSCFTSFTDLVSHLPNPAIGNLLFSKKSFFDVGGYPEHHGFDTQGFGYRLIGGNHKIYTSDYAFYYQRLPDKPSYYAREARAGNINRNWFYIFIEFLYKFSKEIRHEIISFDCSDPIRLAKGDHLFNCLADLSSKTDIYDPVGLNLTGPEAYLLHTNSSDITLQAWCFVHDVENKRFDKAFSRLAYFEENLDAKKVIFPLLVLWFGNKLSSNQMGNFDYFLAENKTLRWKSGLYIQKILNRIGSLL